MTDLDDVEQEPLPAVSRSTKRSVVASLFQWQWLVTIIRVALSAIGCCCKTCPYTSEHDTLHLQSRLNRRIQMSLEASQCSSPGQPDHENTLEDNLDQLLHIQSLQHLDFASNLPSPSLS